MSFAGEAAQVLLACFTTALNERPAPPAYIMLRPGQEVTPLLSTTKDECCQGLAWVRVAGIEVAPSLDLQTGRRCFGTLRQITLELGVMRCAPTPPANTIPTADQWGALFLQLDSDYDAMEAALCCLRPFVEERTDEVPVAGEYEPIGPDGNCIGGRMTITLEADCGCTEQ